MGEDEEELDLDDGEPDEDYQYQLAEATLPFRGKLGWRVAGLGTGLVCDLLECFSVAFHTLSTLLIQRANWEEERQEFSDSVKSDFLVMKKLDTNEKEG